jgi:signal transduction histidine kinase
VRLTLKLALAVLPGALVVVAAAAVLELRRDRAEFDADQRADDRVMARALSDAVARMWEIAGRDRALALLSDANGMERRLHVRWVDPIDARSPLPAAQRAALLRGEEVVWRDASNGDPWSSWLHTLLPVRTAGLAGGTIVGAIDLSEAPNDLRAHIRRTIRATAATTLALGVVMTLLTLLVGVWVVGRPISALIEQARRVGGGDLRARSLPRQRDELGDLARALNLMLDRLEAAAAEVELSTRQRFTALEQLRHADRLTTIGRMASSVAHEMGTPLNVVAGRARLILEDERDAAEHARIIIGETQRLTKIIRQLLDSARRRPPQKERCNLAQLASDVLPALATLASKKRLDIRLQADVPDAPVVADATQVQQALTNLVVNAIQASGEGGAVNVTLRPAHGAPPPGRDPGGEYFEIAVQDHGAGMPPDVLARVFEPFFTTKAVGESTGLGLSVAHDIVGEHGGWIIAESEPGRGSRFTLCLPRSAA